MARKRTPGPAAKPKAPKAATPAKAGTVFRLKIALDWLKPAIWRRIELPDCNLEDLHDVLQVCMPWRNCHLWEFTVGKQCFGMDMDEAEFGGFDNNDSDPAHEAWLSGMVAGKVKKFRYTYDFGDSWDHIITFEKSVARDPKAKYPRCVAGERACPPDDCGGPPGYENLLEILANPKHPDHKDMLNWVGKKFDPEAFDIEATNKALAKLKFT